MKKILLVPLLMLAFVLSAFADEGGYYISDYSFYGYLKHNNEMDVTEVIDVNFTEDRHGIYRNIPRYFHFTDNETGKIYKYYTKVKSVDVQNDEFDAESDSDNFTIKIGSADYTVKGEHRYVINYTIVMPDDRIDNYDFIYYNVLGSSWNVPIGSFTFKVEFENQLPEDATFALYSGAYGNSENNLDVDFSMSGNSFEGSAYNIPSNNAITVYSDFSEGYFTEEKKTGKFLPTLITVAAMLMALYGLYLSFTSKHRIPVQTVEFYPPKNTTSADVGYIVDNSSDDKDLLSLIPYWADKGYIKLEEIPSEKKPEKLDYLRLVKIKELPESAYIYEKELYKLFFAEGDTFDLKDLPVSFGESLSSVKSKLTSSFTGKRALYENSDKAGFIAFLTSLCFGLLFGVTSTAGILENISYTLFGLLPLFMHFTNVSRFHQKRFMKTASKIVKTVFALILGFISIVILFNMTDDYIINEKLIFAAGILTVVSVFFNYRIIQETEYYSNIAGKLLGLKEFIEKAELPKLEMLISQNPSYYYNILPFAMTFGLENKWSKKFININIPSPDWYGNRTGTVFTPAYLNSSINSGISSPVAQVRAEQSKSSGHSGGSSGGGGGGGGGGSW